MRSEYQTLTWNDDLLTGVAQIDEQHLMLVNMFNDANQHLSTERGHEQLADLIHDLMSYALYHFDTEEGLMLQNHYDPQQQTKHIQEHRAFSAKVAGLQHALSQGNPVSTEEVLCFLSDWLRNHILNTDKELGKFLNATPHQLS